MKKHYYNRMLIAGTLVFCIAGCQKQEPVVETTMVATESNISQEEAEEKYEEYVEENNPFTSIALEDIGTIKLAPYDHLAVTLTDYYDSVEESDIDNYIEGELSTYLRDVNGRTSQRGDTVTFDYVGTIDGKEFEGNTVEDYSTVVGDGTLLPDFEKVLYNISAGDDVTATVQFPKDYLQEATAGKTAEFKIHIDRVQEPSVLDEAFIKDHTEAGSTTVEEYREEVRTILSEYFEHQNWLQGIEKAVDQLVEKSTLDPSQEYLDGLYEYYYQNFLYWLNDSGMTLDTYKETLGVDDEAIANDIWSMVDFNSKQIMVLRQIAADQGLDDSKRQEEDLEKFMSQYYDYDPADGSMEDLYGDQMYLMGLQASVYMYLDDYVTIHYEYPEEGSEVPEENTEVPVES